MRQLINLSTVEEIEIGWSLLSGAGVPSSSASTGVDGSSEDANGEKENGV